jgi:NADPH2:quinone reductase
MRAIVITEHGGPQVLSIREIPDPVPADGEVLIRVRAFGVNQAETHMRKGDWPEAAPVSGIECAGSVAHDPAGRLAEGTTVVALMGGMGRTRNGSYAEYVAAPSANVAAVSTSLSWTDLAALPESYATAWSALRGNLELREGQSLLVRGATSALGQAAVNIAGDIGATVIATTRRRDRAGLLRSLGADYVIIDDGAIAGAARELVPGGTDRVLDLVGNSVLRDSLGTVRAAGRVCQAGFLGGLSPVDQFLPIVDLPSGIQFSFFGSFELGTETFPLSRVPIQDIIAKAEAGAYNAQPTRVFSFEQIADAHRLMEGGGAGGKLVVSVQ